MESPRLEYETCDFYRMKGSSEFDRVIIRTILLLVEPLRPEIAQWRVFQRSPPIPTTWGGAPKQ